MEDNMLGYSRQTSCNHKKQQLYTQKRFDVLNGFELTFTRCLNCHKIVALKARKFTRH
jgi:hypothetical protein